MYHEPRLGGSTVAAQRIRRAIVMNRIHARAAVAALNNLNGKRSLFARFLPRCVGVGATYGNMCTFFTIFHDGCEVTDHIVRFVVKP